MGPKMSNNSIPHIWMSTAQLSQELSRFGAADNREDCSRVKHHLKLLQLNARKGLGLLSWEEKGEMSHNPWQAKTQNVYRTQKQESLQIIS